MIESAVRTKAANPGGDETRIYELSLGSYCIPGEPMKRFLTTLFVVVVISVLTWPQASQPNKQGKSLPDVPRTVDEAVLVLKAKWLKPKDLDWILRNPQKEVWARLYMGFGTGMRNEFGLWRGNQALRDSCGNNNPEECSSIILNRLWESVRTDADPALVRQLDCQFQLAQTIRISEKGFYKLTTGELVEALQSQIDNQIKTLATSGTPMCQSALKLQVAGNPDPHCYVYSQWGEEDPSKNEREFTLEGALAGLGTGNLFRTSHEPPNITLNFVRKCQFPTPPYLYGKKK